MFRITTNQQLQNLNQTSAYRPNLESKILTKPSFRISTKIQLHNLYKTSATKYWPNSSFKSWLNFNFKILTKPCAQSQNKSLTLWLNLSLQICNKMLPTRSSSSTSATKYRPNSSFKFCLNFNFKILTKPCAQSLNKSLALWTILSYQICNKLLPIQSSSSTLATVTISTSFELVSSHARVTSIKFTKQQWVSDSVSQLVTSMTNDRTRVR